VRWRGCCATRRSNWPAGWSVACSISPSCGCVPTSSPGPSRWRRATPTTGARWRHACGRRSRTRRGWRATWPRAASSRPVRFGSPSPRGPGSRPTSWPPGPASSCSRAGWTRLRPGTGDQSRPRPLTQVNASCRPPRRCWPSPTPGGRRPPTEPTRCWPRSSTAHRPSPPTSGTAPERRIWPSTWSGPAPATARRCDWPSSPTRLDRRPGR
jgi:hypothetical protein